MSRSPKRVFWLLFGLCFGLAPAVARAQEVASEPGDVVDQVRTLFDEGVALVDAQRWEEAEGVFRRCLAMRRSPVIEYNLASTLEAQGRYVEASGLLGHLLADGEASPELSRAAGALLASVRLRLAQLTVTLGGAAWESTVTIDGRTLTDSEIGASIAVDPGPHRVSARAGEREVAEDVEVGEGEVLRVHLVLPVPGPAAAAEANSSSARADLSERSSRRRRRLWGTVAGVAVAAALAAVLVTRDYSEDPTVGTFPPGLVTVEVGR